MSKCDAAAEKLAPQHKSAFFSFIKSLATFKGDLASLTAPPFLLSPQSIVEFSAYWAENPSLLVAPALESDPEKRALSVLKWFLSTLKEQHNNRDENGNKKRMKPLNPFLGELFIGKWEGGSELGETRLVAEQVSHHPPVTACRVWNEKHGISLRGHVAPKTFFTSTVNIERKGYSILHISEYDEDYMITMPKIHIEGIMTGSLTPELSGTSYIRSSSGYTAIINYSSKGWVSGKSHSFTASLFHDKKPRETLYTVEGQWNGEFVITNARTLETVEKFDAQRNKSTPLTVPPIEKQHPLESRRAWEKVADAIHRNDIFAVGHEKSKVENEQREMRKVERAEGREFPRRYFSKAEGDPVAEELAGGMKRGVIELKDDIVDMKCGVWLWDAEKYEQVNKDSNRENVVSVEKNSMRTRLDSGIGMSVPTVTSIVP